MTTSLPDRQEQLSNLEAAQEASKIFNALTDRDHVASFFLDMGCRLLKARSGQLFRLEQGKLQEEASTVVAQKAAPKISDPETQFLKKIFKNARPDILALKKQWLLALPLVVRSQIWAVAAFRLTEAPEKKEAIYTGMALADPAASAIKNIEFYQEKLRAQRMATIGQTISILSHEMKNRLGVLLGHAFLMNRRLNKKEWAAAQRSWSGLHEGLHELQEYVLNLLSMTRERQTVMKKTNLNQLMQKTVKEFQVKAKKKGLRLTAQLPKHPIQVSIDVSGLTSVLQNLIGNAIEACDKKKQSIQVKLAQDKEKNLHVFVKDTGPGMPPEVQNKIFNLFFTTKGHKGTGLGLVICEKIIKEHGGHMQCHSAVGKGTQFEIFLPSHLITH